MLLHATWKKELGIDLGVLQVQTIGFVLVLIDLNAKISLRFANVLFSATALSFVNKMGFVVVGFYTTFKKC